MKKLIAIMVLMMAGAVFGTTYYVDAAADAGGDGTTSALTGANCAFQTIQQGIDTDAAVTNIIVAAGTYAEADGTYGLNIGLTVSGNAITITGAGASTTKIRANKASVVAITGGDGTNLTLNGLSIESSETVGSDASMILLVTTADNIVVDIVDCVIGTASAVGEVALQRGINFNADTVINLTVSGTTIYGRGANRSPVYLYDSGSASFTNCTIDSKDTGGYRAAVVLRGTNTTLSFDGCTVTTQEDFIEFVAGSVITQIECYNSNVTATGTAPPFNIPSVAAGGTLPCNRVICTNNTFSNSYAGAAYGIYIGLDGQANEPLDLIIVNNNDVIKTNGTGTEHGILICPNQVGASVVGNRVRGFGYGLIIKGEGHTVKDNQIIQGTHATDGHCLYLKSSWGSTVENNLFVGNSTSGSVIDVLTQNLFVAIEGYNIVRNNIVIGTGSGDYTIFLNNEYHSNIFDYNLYTSAATRLFDADDDADNITTIEGVRAWWLANATTKAGCDNDTHSILRTVSVSYNNDGWPVKINGLVAGENYGPVALQPTGSGSRGLNRTN